MRKKKAKFLTRQEVVDICHNMIFSRYMTNLEKNLRAMQRQHKKTEREMQHQMWEMQTETSIANLDLRLSKFTLELNDLAFKVMLHDYIIGRMNKQQLIQSLNESYDGDSLSMAERIEQFDIEKDKFEAHIRQLENGSEPS